MKQWLECDGGRERGGGGGEGEAGVGGVFRAVLARLVGVYFCETPINEPSWDHAAFIDDFDPRRKGNSVAMQANAAVFIHSAGARTATELCSSTTGKSTAGPR